MDQPAGKRVTCRPPGQPGNRKSVPGGGQHQVAEPAAAQHRSISDQAGVGENGAHCRNPGAGVRQRRAIADVRGVDTSWSQHPGHRDGELSRRQVGRGPASGEKVRDHHIKGPGRNLLKGSAGITDPEAYPARPASARPASASVASALIQRQPPPDKLRQRGIRLHRQLAGSGPGCRHVAGQGQAAAAQVQYPQRLPGWRGQVDQMPDPPHVLELQVLRIIKVNM